MKLSKDTYEILKNYAAINMSLLVREGNTIRTCSPQKTVLAVAKIAENIPKQFAVYDLNQLLGTVSLFDDPDFEFTAKSLKISDQSGDTTTHNYAAQEAIVSAPEKDIVLKDVGIEFDLDANKLSRALKAAGVIGLPNVAFIGKNKKVYISAIDSNNDSSHSWESPVGTTDGEFKLIYRLDNLKILPRDYHVEISTTKGHTRLTSKDGKLTYFIAAESNSIF